MTLSDDPRVPRQRVPPVQPTPTAVVSTRECNGHVIVVLAGELDMFSAALVTGGLTAAAVRDPQVIVDLAALEFIDCGGITALVRGHKLARAAGGELRLAAPRPRVLRILTLARLTAVIPIHTSAAEAAAIATAPVQWARTSIRPVLKLRVTEAASAAYCSATENREFR